ncbi:uncharacterized protein [Battus philenor]|uniref:uncharacterized protein n=1 Tax=Battus philenor TaxID=42288 RepID=UPI0035CECD03
MMLLKTLGGTLIAVFSVSFVSHLIYDYYRRKRQRRVTRKEVNEVIMFSYGASELTKSKYSRCFVTPSMDRLLYYLNAPRHNIDICMFLITNSDVSNVLMKLHHRGIKIRLIIDADMVYSQGSSVKRLQKYGIPVRWMKSVNIMHHKFSLVDTLVDNKVRAPFVIMGSLNWTNQALNGNWEDVTVTSQRDIVEQYRAEFERLWILFKPIVDFT